MPENEYLLKMKAMAAEALAKKQGATLEEQPVAEQSIEGPSVEEGLETHRASVELAKTKDDEVQELTAQLSHGQEEVAQFEALAPQLKELGITDPDFDTKLNEAKLQVNKVQGRITTVTQERDTAADIGAQAVTNPEVMTAIHEEALEENKEVKREEQEKLYQTIVPELKANLEAIYIKAFEAVNGSLDRQYQVRDVALAGKSVAESALSEISKRLRNLDSVDELHQYVDRFLSKDSNNPQTKAINNAVTGRTSEVFAGELGGKLDKFYGLQKEIRGR